jgi:hypothetical protein
MPEARTKGRSSFVTREAYRRKAVLPDSKDLARVLEFMQRRERQDAY